MRDAWNDDRPAPLQLFNIKNYNDVFVIPRCALRVFVCLFVSRYIVCDQHKSEARFLISRLNPSVTHNTTDGSQGQPIFTDDVSLRVFMEHLMKLSTQS